MMKPTDNDVRATDLSGGCNGEFPRRLWRGDGSEPFFKPPTSPFCFIMCWSPTQCLCSLVWNNIYKGGGHAAAIMHKSEVKNGQGPPAAAAALQPSSKADDDE